MIWWRKNDHIHDTTMQFLNGFMYLLCHRIKDTFEMVFVWNTDIRIPIGISKPSDFSNQRIKFDNILAKKWICCATGSRILLIVFVWNTGIRIPIGISKQSDFSDQRINFDNIFKKKWIYLLCHRIKDTFDGFCMKHRHKNSNWNFEAI